MPWALLAVVALAPLAAAAQVHPPGWTPSDSIRQLATFRSSHDTVTLLAPARIARYAARDAAAWQAYIARSRAMHARDTAAMHAELRAIGRDTMSRAPYTHDFSVQPWMTPSWFATDTARRMAESVLSYQAPNGGWSKHVDFRQGTRAPGQSYFAESNAWSWISTLDNDATTEEIRFLARADAARPDERYRAAVLRGIDYLLAAQQPTGCWPQTYPLEGSYHDAATLNDGAIVNTMEILDEAARGTWTFVPDGVRRAAAAASKRGVDCLLAMQVVVDGKRTVWGQQHDPLTLAPTSARSYELTSLTGLESVAVVDYLMRIPTPDARVVDAVHAAAAWYRTTAMNGYAYEGSELTQKAGGPTLWARLYEIGTNRPIFSNRDGVLLYDFDRLTDRRRGYAWFTVAPDAMLRRYDRWARSHIEVRK